MRARKPRRRALLHELRLAARGRRRGQGPADRSSRPGGPQPHAARSRAPSGGGPFRRRTARAPCAREDRLHLVLGNSACGGPLGARPGGRARSCGRREDGDALANGRSCLRRRGLRSLGRPPRRDRRCGRRRLRAHAGGRGARGGRPHQAEVDAQVQQALSVFRSAGATAWVNEAQALFAASA
jgi:hypothetical protein